MLLQWPWLLTHQDQCNWRVAVLVLRDRNCPLSKTMQGEATSRSRQYKLGKDAPRFTIRTLKAGSFRRSSGASGKGTSMVMVKRTVEP